MNVKRFFGSPFELSDPYSWERAHRVMQQLLFDTAPSFWHGPTEINCALENLGVERLTLGSD